MNVVEKVDVARLGKILSALEIFVGEGPDGSFTAYSTSEPLFCVVRPSLDDVKTAIDQIVTSYLHTFHSAEAVKIQFAEANVDRKVIPVENVKPISRLTPKPHAGGFDFTGTRYAVG